MQEDRERGATGTDRGPVGLSRGDIELRGDDETSLTGATFGEGIETTISAGGEQYTLRLEKNEVRAKLPFAVDLTALSRDLVRLGYSLARAEDDTRAQGWGRVDDREDYMPYWVYHEADGWYLAFAPEDYYSSVPTSSAADPGSSPRVGRAAEDELRRWLPVLRRARA